MLIYQKKDKIINNEVIVSIKTTSKFISIVVNKLIRNKIECPQTGAATLLEKKSHIK